MTLMTQRWNGLERQILWGRDYVPRCYHSFLNNILSPFKTEIIICYTNYKRNGVKFRANPSYRSNQEWYDWAVI